MGANAQTSVLDFTNGQVLTGPQMDISAGTGVPVFATTVTRDAAFGGANKVLAEGQTCYLESTNVVQYYDGAAWATVGPTAASGLVLLQTLSPSAVTSAQFTDGLLDSTYFNYVVTVSVTFAAIAGLLVQMRNAAATITAANYQVYAAGMSNAGTTSTNRTATGTTSWTVGYGSATIRYAASFNLFSPSVSGQGSHVAISNGVNSADTAATVENIGLRYGANQAFTSLIFTSAQAFTGTICVYGVSK